MPFEAGNQEAKKANHKKPRIITQKLIARLQDAEGAALDRMVAAIIARAQEGDVPAFREIMDRVEGKAPQPVVGGDDDDAPIRLESIVRKIVEPRTND